MLDRPQHDFRTAELDPDLLSTLFRVQTNWHVITGTVSSGKTTLIPQSLCFRVSTRPIPG